MSGARGSPAGPRGCSVVLGWGGQAGRAGAPWGSPGTRCETHPESGRQSSNSPRCCRLPGRCRGRGRNGEEACPGTDPRAPRTRPALLAYPLGHLMLGGSFRNQGRYLWNCCTDGRTGPSVRLTQLFRQAREPAETAGAQRRLPGRPARPCHRPVPPGPGRQRQQPVCTPEHAAFLPNGERCPPTRETAGPCGRLREGSWGQSSSPAGPAQSTSSTAAPGAGPRATSAQSSPPCAQGARVLLRRDRGVQRGVHPSGPGHPACALSCASAPPRPCTRPKGASPAFAFLLPQFPQATVGQETPETSYSLTVEGQNSSLWGPKA